MPSESILRLKEYYENGEDNIGRDLIRTCLKECKKYRRGTAFFGSTSFITYSDALLHVIKDNVKIEILCSPVINDRSLLDTLQRNLSQEEKLETIQKFQESIIYKATKYQNDPNDNRKFGSQLLAYLIAKEQLEIKLAIKKSEDWPDPWPTDDEIEEKENSHLYHVKRGYFEFEDEKKVVFSGSFNERFQSLERNFEDANVYKTWLSNDLSRAERIINRVNRDWEGETDTLYIRKLSKELIEKIKDSAVRDRASIRRPKNQDEPEVIDIPEINEEQNNEIIERPYQFEALANWEKNNYKGILAMATGSGKTRTAISAIKKIKDANPSSFILIVVPKISLATQWLSELKKFSVEAFGAFTNQNWENKITDIVMGLAIKGNDYKMPTIVAVRDTFVSEKFQEKINHIQQEIDSKFKFIVVDECHHFNKQKSISCLPDFFNYRLGLSATPFNQYEEDNDESKFLYEFFDKEVYSYTLENALNDGWLTPYYYYVITVELDEEETEKLEELSIKIARAYSALKNNDSDENQSNLDKLNSEKNRLIGSVKDKLLKLENLIKNKKEGYALAYCGASSDDDSEGIRKRHIQKVSRIFDDNNWRVGKITSDESLNIREQHISDLEHNLIDVIVSIKVLDEGIDIPCCKTAYILASSKSNREFIQRRGRVLRKFGGKEHATIYDFVITNAATKSEALKNVIDDEFYRVKEFANLAINRDDIYNEFSKELLKDE